jgi:hypothetical protein
MGHTETFTIGTQRTLNGKWRGVVKQDGKVIWVAILERRNRDNWTYPNNEPARKDAENAARIIAK